MLPPSTYDNVWVKSGKPDASSQYVTSDQCVGCHSAGGTGLQFDMTEPGPDGKLINVSPYGTWRGSPMGLAGRDPIFFAQLASETDTFHPGPGSKEMVQDTCLGCHGILGQRQYGIDTAAKSGACSAFPREAVDAKPYKPGNPLDASGALRRAGARRHLVRGLPPHGAGQSRHREIRARAAEQMRARSVRPHSIRASRISARRSPEASWWAHRTSSTDRSPIRRPCRWTTRSAIVPEHNATILQSETCGSCHTVHLPIMHPDQTIGHVYEQTTYPEWAFSDYRTGTSPDGALPHGKGPRAQSCQGCHMPNTDAAKKPYRSKIASIQEYTNFPQAEHTCGAEGSSTCRRATASPSTRWSG